MNENLFEEIASYIIKTVQEESILSGFQYVVSEAAIQARFGVEIRNYINDKILDVTAEREEVAEIYLDTDGFDTTIYTDFAPNYDEEDDEE